LRENAQAVGDWICEKLRAELSEVPGVQVIRNAGMMIGIQLDRPCGELVSLALAHQLLINVTAENVVRLLPPLVMKQDEADQLVRRLIPLIKGFLVSPDSA